MRAWRWVLVIVMLAGCLPAVAQPAQPGQPAPPAQPEAAIQPAPPAPPAQAVTLRYKFKPNDVTAYRMYVTGQANVGATGLPAGPQMPQGQIAVPLQGTATATTRQRVLGVKPDGVATLRFVVDAMNLRGMATLQGKTSQVDVAMDAKGMRLKVDGKPVQQPPEAANEMKKGNIFGKPMLMKMDPLGRVVGMTLPDMPAFKQAMPGFDLSKLMQASQGMQSWLPDKPVSVGETWQKTVTMPLPGVAQPIQAQITSQLLAVGPDSAGRTVAKIQQNTNLNADNLVFRFTPPGASEQGISFTFDRLREMVNGTVLWSVDEGKPLRMDMDVSFDMAMTMMMPMPTPQGQVQPQQVQAFVTLQGKMAMAKI